MKLSLKLNNRQYKSEMEKNDLNLLCDRIYKDTCEHGFHDNGLSNEHFLCLVISELMKAVEAAGSNRRNKHANVNWFNKRIETSRIYKGLDPEIPKERGFEVIYNETIKGSIEEKLADSAIRLFDLAGLRNIKVGHTMKDINGRIDDMAEACKDETFTETIYAISTLPARHDGLYDFSTIINDMLISILGLAKHLDIDLVWHIEQKMKYIQFCEKIYGK